MDYQQILQEMITALKTEAGEGYSTIKGFAEQQGKLLAQQAEEIATSRVAGTLKDNDDLYHFFLDSLKVNTENMAKHIAMLSILTVEKAWNAVANALWKGLRTILSTAGIPDALLPQTPPRV